MGLANFLTSKTTVSPWPDVGSIPRWQDHPVVSPHLVEQERLIEQCAKVERELARARTVEQAVKTRQLHRLDPPAEDGELDEVVPVGNRLPRVMALEQELHALSVRVSLAEGRAKAGREKASQEIDEAMRQHMTPVLREWLRLQRAAARVGQRLMQLDAERFAKSGRIQHQVILRLDQLPECVADQAGLLRRDGWSIEAEEPVAPAVE